MIAADIAPTDGIRTVGREDAPLLAEITADAFRNDPFNSWLFSDHKAMHRTFGVLARHIYGPNGFCQILSDGEKDLAATMWMLPGGNMNMPLSGVSALYASLFFNGGFSALMRGKAAGEAMELHHPKERHAYLFTVGVCADGRGRGLGRQMLVPVLEACDRTGTMVYLENSNPDNRRFYNSLGFERIELFGATPESPPLEAMRREPQAGRDS